MDRPAACYVLRNAYSKLIGGSNLGCPSHTSKPCSSHEIYLIWREGLNGSPLGFCPKIKPEIASHFALRWRYQGNYSVGEVWSNFLFSSHLTPIFHGWWISSLEILFYSQEFFISFHHFHYPTLSLCFFNPILSINTFTYICYKNSRKIEFLEFFDYCPPSYFLCCYDSTPTANSILCLSWIWWRMGCGMHAGEGEEGNLAFGLSPEIGNPCSLINKRHWLVFGQELLPWFCISVFNMVYPLLLAI